MPPIVVTVMLLLLYLATSAQAAGSLPQGDPTSILANARSNINRITSVKYEFNSIAQQNDATIAFHCVLILKGKKFHNAYEISNSKAPVPMKQTIAYDGHTYQVLEGDASLLGEDTKIATERPYFLPQPINTMFEFAYRPKEARTLDTLRESGRWDELAARSKVLPDKKVGDFECAVLEFAATPGSTGPTTVAFAKDYNYYPVEVMRSEDLGSTRSVVQELRLVETAAGSVAIPMKIREVSTPKGTSQDIPLETTIVPGSLSVNEDIPDSTFTIPRSQASLVFDVEKKQVVSAGRPIPSKPKLVDVSPWYAQAGNWLVICAGLALLSAIAIVISRRFRPS